MKKIFLGCIACLSIFSLHGMIEKRENFPLKDIVIVPSDEETINKLEKMASNAKTPDEIIGYVSDITQKSSTVFTLTPKNLIENATSFPLSIPHKITLSTSCKPIQTFTGDKRVSWSVVKYCIESFALVSIFFLLAIRPLMHEKTYIFIMVAGEKLFPLFNLCNANFEYGISCAMLSVTAWLILHGFFLSGLYVGLKSEHNFFEEAYKKITNKHKEKQE